jgi:hypothetical protein
MCPGLMVRVTFREAPASGLASLQGACSSRTLPATLAMLTGEQIQYDDLLQYPFINHNRLVSVLAFSLHLRILQSNEKRSPSKSRVPRWDSIQRMGTINLFDTCWHRGPDNVDTVNDVLYITEAMSFFRGQILS